MLKISGKYGTATVYSKEISNSIWNSIFSLLSSPMVDGAEIRVMPNIYEKGRYISGLAIIGGRGISPAVVGEDIGCGTLCVKLKENNIDLNELDDFIKHHIAIDKNKVPHRYANNIDLYRVRARLKNEDRMYYELGSLGYRGNFIEIGKDDNKELYLMVHTGSRNLGSQISNYWQDFAYRSTRYDYGKVLYELSWLEGPAKQMYLEDINRASLFARWNRAAIVDEILRGMHLHDVCSLETTHNNVVGGVIRCGAISAKNGERVVIPLTKSDGFILGTGRGSRDWNYSAPSGLGRREGIKSKICRSNRSKEGRLIFTSYHRNKCSTVEMSKAYKSVDDVLPLIVENVDIEEIIKPVYNFKAC